MTWWQAFVVAVLVVLAGTLLLSHRYTFLKDEYGFYRMDSLTGQVHVFKPVRGSDGRVELK